MPVAITLTHTHRCTSSPFTPFPLMIFNAHSKKRKKEKGQNTQTLGLSLPTTLSPFQHVFISVMSHTNTQRPLPDLDAPTQPLSSSFQSYAHSMQNTSAHTHFPASDDSGLSSQMLCIFFSTYTDRHTPLRTVLVFSEHMYCRAEFMLNSGSLQHGILKLSHTCLLRKNQKRNPCLFFGYILNNRHFSPRQKMTSGCVLAQLLPLERFVYHHKSVCFIATLLTARRYYSCCNQLYR